MQNNIVIFSCSNGLWLAILLTIAYVACKLLGFISFSWLWAISPILVYTFILTIVFTIIIAKDNSNRLEK